MEQRGRVRSLRNLRSATLEESTSTCARAPNKHMPLTTVVQRYGSSMCEPHITTPPAALLWHCRPCPGYSAATTFFTTSEVRCSNGEEAAFRQPAGLSPTGMVPLSAARHEVGCDGCRVAGCGPKPPGVLRSLPGWQCCGTRVNWDGAPGHYPGRRGGQLSAADSCNHATERQAAPMIWFSLSSCE
jgi:hypothetical protein